jgi:pimeloyl-ACP methyl ester carboxylesterase
MFFKHLSRRRAAIAALLLAVTVGAACSTASNAPSTSDPLPGFHDGTADNDGVSIHYVIGGQGPAVVLLHGWPETWRAWSTIAPDLAKDHTVIAVDLRGFGDSGFAKSDDGGYTAPAVATDIHTVTQQLKLGSIDLIGHDWGGAVALSYAAQYRADVKHLAVIEAPPSSDYLNLVQAKPGLLWWDWLAKGPKGNFAEQLIAGKEREFYGHFYQESEGAIDKDESDRYIAGFSEPGRTHAALEYFRQQDVGEKQVDDMLAKDGKLTIPVLGIGGAHSMGSAIGGFLPRVADHVTTDVVPNANHWVLEENPSYLLDSVRKFLTT